MPSASATRQACWPPAPPKQLQRVAGDVVAALHRDLLDRVGHVLDRDLDEAVGDLFRRASAADLFAPVSANASLHRVGVERLVLLGPEDLREEIGDELADHARWRR